ncbi:MAG TPA: peptidoglycan editing factor PgeF [Desulfitobacteriaceae bacterium]|nr:peptidoglycan editing factor PgeF [Desulfitobacteriaceae bacterium]
MTWEWCQGSDLEYLALPAWAAEGIEIGFSSRLGGVSKPPFTSLNLGLHVNDKIGNVLENRRRWFAEWGAVWSDLVIGEQVHGTQVVWVDQQSAGSGACCLDTILPDVDGLLTQSRLGLAALFADCVPIYFYHPLIKAVGIAHAGWKGTLGKISHNVLHKLAAAGGKAEDCWVALGPSIGPCCYQIDQALATSFRINFVQKNLLSALGPGTFSLDLREANRSLLIEAGVRPDLIWMSAACTACDSNKFFSHRRDGALTGRMSAWIRLVGI